MRREQYHLYKVGSDEKLLLKNPYYLFVDGVFQFYCAWYGSWARDKRIVFRVREDRDIAERAKEKDIKQYDRIMPAATWERDQWLAAHPGFGCVELSANYQPNDGSNYPRT